jgi:hypothetical protein
MSKMFWFTAGIAIGTTAGFLTAQANESSGTDVMARAKDLYGRGRKIVEGTIGAFPAQHKS